MLSCIVLDEQLITYRHDKPPVRSIATESAPATVEGPHPWAITVIDHKSGSREGAGAHRSDCIKSRSKQEYCRHHGVTGLLSPESHLKF
ncbi:hypothetical protein EVAR_75702_1 [Eumeta japonica]|uniref:Uncharacterized protein n=1 Tax=Eumeta variegata TaxID=151549 RepID=A0A4C1W199_EUMVA|nr:hypothetical protein EVAR_75702_1 [Eumeta japonica]